MSCFLACFLTVYMQSGALLVGQYWKVEKLGLDAGTNVFASHDPESFSRHSCRRIGKTWIREVRPDKHSSHRPSWYVTYLQPTKQYLSLLHPPCVKNQKHNSRKFKAHMLHPASNSLSKFWNMSFQPLWSTSAQCYGIIGHKNGVMSLVSGHKIASLFWNAQQNYAT